MWTFLFFCTRKGDSGNASNAVCVGKDARRLRLGVMVEVAVVVVEVK